MGQEQCRHGLVLPFAARAHLRFQIRGRAHINNIELGKYGRHRSNVWNYAGVSSFGAGRSDLQLHPTVKPVAMVEDAIRDCSRRKGIILDPFIGSGTTLIAAERAGRIGYGIEIDPQYCDVALRRLHAVCDLEAVLEPTGERFEALAEALPSSCDFQAVI